MTDQSTASVTATLAPTPTATFRQDPLRAAHASIVLCPGQGAQAVGMGKAWIEKHEVARKTFEEADAVLGFELTKLCFEGPEDQLTRTDFAQPAIYTTSVACYRVLNEQGKIGRVSATAGLSLGEFTALHIAGAFDFETGLKLVRLRGQAMQAAAEATPSGMVALIGTDETQARMLCDRTLGTSTTEVLVPANFNCPGQIVLSGSLNACERALRVAEETGMRATQLKVAGAFHSPLMKPAAQKLAEALDQITWQTPVVPVSANVTGILHEINKIDYIKQRLVDQLTGAVRWEQSMIWLITHMPGAFLELAPGKSLSGLMKRIDRATKVENYADPV